MSDRIDLVGIEVYARHGVLQQEQETAQVFRVDVTAFLDLEVPGETDHLSDTMDYATLAHDVREVVGSESHNLIEKVATRVAETVLEHVKIDRVVVTVHKPEAPLDVAVSDVSVTIDRAR